MRPIDQLFLELTEKKVRLWTEAGRLRIKAPTGVMTDGLRKELAARKSEILAFLSQDEALPTLTLKPDNRYDPFPLTDVQHAYWLGRSGFFDLGNIATHGYSEHDCIDLDLVRLNQTWQMLIDRHDMLRMVVTPDGKQRILADAPVYEIQIADLRHVSPAEREEALMATREEMSHQVFNPETWPLFDIRVSQIDEQRVRLYVSIDLLLIDAFSGHLLFSEWRQLYTDPKHETKPLELTFRDYLLTEAELETSALYTNARSYWLDRVATLPLAPELPLERQLHEVEKPTFVRHAHELSQERWEQFQAHAKAHNLSASEALLAGFALVLGAWSKNSHFTLNLTVLNRLPLHPQVMEVIGDFTNLNLLEVNVTTVESFVSAAHNIQQQLWRDLDHRHFGGVRVLRELAKVQGSQVLMPVVFTSILANSGDSGYALFGEEVYAISQTSQVWLDYQVSETHGKLTLNWDVVAELFPSGLMEDMFGAYCSLLEQLADNAAFWSSDNLVLVPERQLAQRTTVNATEAPVSSEMLHTLFLKQVDAHATDPAVITTTHMLTYQELFDRANQLGHWLRSQGAKPNTLVAVVMEKGWEQIAAVLGIYMAGAAYLPIDPTLPTERLHYLLAQGEVTIALTQEQLVGQLSWPSTVQRLAVDTIVLDPSLEPLNVVQTPTDLAYVIYTSGSTGLPKGVVIDHRGAVNTVLDVNQRYGITEADRVLALSALNFDLSVYDIFGLLATGGAIVMPDPDRRIDPEHWTALIDRYGVTVWDTVPALIQMLVEYVEGRNENPQILSPFNLETLRVVMMSGDWIPVTLPDRIKALWPSGDIYSMGGATEASIWSIYYPIGEVDPEWPSIPYGKPMTNQCFHILDANLNPRPIWVPGDLYIGGIGVALGYWKDEERTNASFITHPHTGERLYKTGDLGRYLPDGNIEFLGRDDFQVKIQGHRIELGEIENALLQHTAIDEVVVSAVGAPKGNRQLVAYVVGELADSDDKKTNGQSTPEATPIEELAGVTLQDPLERLTFKLQQPGVRSLNGKMQVTIHLPQPELDDAFRAEWLRRQSYRHFVDESIPLEVFSRFLTCLMQVHLDDAPLPKYRYPSAGGLYPIQCYLYVKSERIAGLEAGFYYYQPINHQLQWVGDSDGIMARLFPAINQGIYEEAAFTLFLVAAMDAIVPMYGELAQNFCLLEAGYISQLLMMDAPKQNLGLCPVGINDEMALHGPLGLTSDHQLLHTLAGGRIDPAQTKVWVQEGKPTQQASWQERLRDHLAAKLPGYMVPSQFVALEALPLTANGKVNRKALPTPDLTETSVVYVAPESDLETQLCMIFSELAEVEEISTAREFAELGLNSVHMVSVANQLRKTLNREIPIAALFQHTTVQTLARYLGETNGSVPTVQEELTTARGRRQKRAQARLARRQRQRV